MKAILLGLLFTVALTGVRAGYHEEIGIPLALRTKEAEYKLFVIETNEKSAKIVDGEVVYHHEHPYLAGLLITLRNSLSVCGSSLVTADRLVTAAHCAFDDYNVPARKIEVVLGSQYLHYGGLRHIASRVSVHPGYNPNFSKFNNDIAVIYLPEPVGFSNRIQPISLPKPSNVRDQFAWEEVVAAGYGVTSGNQVEVPQDTEVHQVWLQVIPEDTCRNFYSRYTRPGSIICTSGGNSVGTCRGDSGGPLVITENGWKILVGVTSFGSLKCQVGYPSGFTRVSSFMDFIESNLR